MSKFSCYFSIIFMVLFLSVSPGELYGRVDFIIPGLFLDSLSVGEGCSVKYLVVNEVFGERDSTELLIDYALNTGNYPEIRISSFSFNEGRKDTFSVIFLFKRPPENIHSSDEFKDSIKEILVKEGDQPLRHPSEEELRKFGFEELFSRPDFDEVSVSPDVELISTSCGDFKCRVRGYKQVTRKKVKLGGIDAVKVEEISVTLWKSVDVPLFNLVKSRIERKRVTRPISSYGLEISKPRKSITTTYLLGYTRK